MSRQKAGRPTGGSQPTAQGKRPAQPSAKQQYAQGTRGNIPPPPRTTSSQAGAQRRPVTGTRKPVKKSGFRLRPLDIALILGGIIVVGIIVMSALSAPAQAIDPNATITNSTKVPVGQPAPDFTLQDPEGNSYTLSAQKGKVVLLEFMATWCPHCQNEAPMYDRLLQKYKDRGVEIWGINATPRNRTQTGAATVDDLKWFRETYNTQVPLLFDKTLGSANAYGITGYPQVYLIDKQGNVAVQPPAESLFTEAELTQHIETLLQQ
ncbi:MAG TPA: peroxiredoxin family protein [Chloroflexia bacterium]|nr:peroxiredoxin family protein [Chloroflexia bacterium]